MVIKLFIVILISVSQSSFANSCYHFFNLSALRFLEDSNSHFNSYLAQNGILSTVMSIPQKRYLFGLIKKDPRNKKFILETLERVSKFGFASERDRYQTSVDLVSALYGSRWFRFVKQSKADRLEESVRYSIYQHILDEGFQSFLDQASFQQKLSLWQHTKRVVRRIKNSQTLNWLGLPGILPSFRSVAIPEELVFKIVWEGYETHKDELNIYFPGQNKRDIYNFIRPIHTVIYFSLIALYADHLYVEMKAQVELAQTQAAVEQVRSVGQSALDFVVDYKSTSREQALQESITELEAELQRPVTAEELEMMRKIIYEE